MCSQEIETLPTPSANDGWDEATIVAKNRITDSQESVLRYRSKNSGGNIEEAIPDPIPNSEVKLFGADGTAWGIYVGE